MLAKRPLFSARRSRRLTVALFAALIGLPLLIALTPVERAQTTSENRYLSAAPDFPTSLEATAAYPAAFDKYFRDNFGFRDWLIRLHSLVRFRLFGAGKNNVVLGKDGWMYWTNAGGTVLGQSQGFETYTERQTALWKAYFAPRQKWFRERGIEYLMVFAPNKSSIYPDFLPDWLQSRIGLTEIDQLHAMLPASDWQSIADLRAVLLDERERTQVYWKTDTHWNDWGAYVGYREIIERLRPAMPGLVALAPDDLEAEQDQTFDGGMSRYLNLGGIVTEATERFRVRPELRAREVEIDIELPADIEALLARQQASIRRWTTGRPGPRAVVMGDSFLDGLLPYLVTHFSETYRWGATEWPSYEFIEMVKPDVVIQEIVERSLRYPPQDPWPPAQ